MNLSILGPQGSGKGTQAEKLAKKYNLAHIDVGEALRHAALKKNKLGRTIDKIINKQKILVPNDIALKVLESKIRRVPQGKGLILDGAPRRVDQIEDMEKLLTRHHRKFNKVIYIDIPEKLSIQRISKRYHCYCCSRHLILGKDIKSPKEKCPFCGCKIVRRPDDTSRGVKKRLAIFRQETLPVVKHFRQKGKLVQVNGADNINQTFSKIIKKL